MHGSFKKVGAIALFTLAVSAAVAWGQARPGTTSDVVRNQPHVGLNKNSYGALDPGFQITEYCDGVTASSRRMTSGLTNPLGRLQRMMERNLPIENRELVQDRNIQSADLQHNFRTLLANHQYPKPEDANQTNTYYTASVALLDRNPANLVFWWVADFVDKSEVDAAATEFCQRQSMGVTSQGSAAVCADRSVIQFGGNPLNVTRTYVLSAYTCAGPAPAPAAQ